MNKTEKTVLNTDFHTISDLENYMMELVEMNMYKTRSKQTEFNWLKREYKRFKKENCLFSESEFIKAYYMACFYLCDC